MSAQTYFPHSSTNQPSSSGLLALQGCVSSLNASLSTVHLVQKYILMGIVRKQSRNPWHWNKWLSSNAKAPRRQSRILYTEARLTLAFWVDHRIRSQRCSKGSSRWNHSTNRRITKARRTITSKTRTKTIRVKVKGTMTSGGADIRLIYKLWDCRRNPRGRGKLVGKESRRTRVWGRGGRLFMGGGND